MAGLSLDWCHVAMAAISAGTETTGAPLRWCNSWQADPPRAGILDSAATSPPGAALKDVDPAVGNRSGCVLAMVAIGWEGETQTGAFFGSAALVLAGLLWGLRQKLRRPSVTSQKYFTDPAGHAQCPPQSKPNLAHGRPGRGGQFFNCCPGCVSPDSHRARHGRISNGWPRPICRCTSIWATTKAGWNWDLPTRDEKSLGEHSSPCISGATGRGCQLLESVSDHPATGAWRPRIPVWSQPVCLGRASPLPDHWLDPWQLLESELGSDDTGRPIVPMILDRETAYYSLHLYRVGDRMTIRDQFDQAVTMQIVGLLAGSLLQGDLLISQSHFQQLFPSRAGTQFFLLAENQTPSRKAESGKNGQRRPRSRLATGKPPGRQRLRYDPHRAAIGPIHGGPKHLSVDIPESGHAGNAAGNIGTGRRPVARRAATTW